MSDPTESVRREVEAQSPNSSSHKMPSFNIVESEFKPWWNKQGFIDYPSVSIKKVYRIIARHIGR